MRETLNSLVNSCSDGIRSPDFSRWESIWSSTCRLIASYKGTGERDFLCISNPPLLSEDSSSKTSNHLSIPFCDFRFETMMTITDNPIATNHHMSDRILTRCKDPTVNQCVTTPRR
jgi:hypothetical protein